MDKGFDDACDMKLRHISFLNVLSKSNNMNKTASTREILSHNRLKRRWTEKMQNSTNLQQKRSVVKQIPQNYCQPGSPRQITERNLRKIRSLVMNVKVM